MSDITTVDSPSELPSSGPLTFTGGAGAKRVRWGRPLAFTAAGLVAGGLLAGSLSASADESATTPSPSGLSSTSSTAPAGAPDGVPDGARGDGDPAHSRRPDEQLLTGTTAAKVRAAALAKYPGATVLRVETDSDGVYEAHLIKADGAPVAVEVDSSFEVTGNEAGGFGGMCGGGPRGSDPSGSASASGSASGSGSGSGSASALGT